MADLKGFALKCNPRKMKTTMFGFRGETILSDLQLCHNLVSATLKYDTNVAWVLDLLDAGSFGFKQKMQFVVKIAKKGPEEDLILESRILRKIFDEPVDSNQTFFPFLYGYHNG